MKRLAIFLLLLSLSGPGHAGDDHDHGHSHAEIKVPATLPELRSEIAARQKTLGEALAAREAVQAHAATDVLAACVRAIPGMLTGLDEATLQRVTGMANNAAKAWGQTAHDADHGDFDKAGREAGKADASYRLLEARLPNE
jgi:hypothetical protein